MLSTLLSLDSDLRPAPTSYYLDARALPTANEYQYYVSIVGGNVHWGTVWKIPRNLTSSTPKPPTSQESLLTIAFGSESRQSTVPKSDSPPQIGSVELRGPPLRS